MNEMQIIFWSKTLFNHQAPHCGAIALEKILLNDLGFVMRHVKMARDEFSDSNGNSDKQIGSCRVDGVVQIKASL